MTQPSARTVRCRLDLDAAARLVDIEDRCTGDDRAALLLQPPGKAGHIALRVEVRLVGDPHGGGGREGQLGDVLEELDVQADLPAGVELGLDPIDGVRLDRVGRRRSGAQVAVGPGRLGERTDASDGIGVGGGVPGGALDAVRRDQVLVDRALQHRRLGGRTPRRAAPTDRRSSTATRAPARTSRQAVVSPVMPAPTTTTSQCRSCTRSPRPPTPLPLRSGAVERRHHDVMPYRRSGAVMMTGGRR
ncbi:MAG: hypothetical protein R2699_02285 [Acidimicrobiales bacterium]